MILALIMHRFKMGNRLMRNMGVDCVAGCVPYDQQCRDRLDCIWWLLNGADTIRVLVVLIAYNHTKQETPFPL